VLLPPAIASAHRFSFPFLDRILGRTGCSAGGGSRSQSRFWERKERQGRHAISLTHALLLCASLYVRGCC
jgi:hypothetical protein